MSVTTPPPLDDLPATPDRSDRPTFSARSTALFDFLKATGVPQWRAMLANVFANASDAATSAGAADSSRAAAAIFSTAASVSATAAAAAAGASMWVAGNYAFGVVVWSPITLFAYRRITAGTTSSATDPSADPAGWKLLGTASALSSQQITSATPVQLYTGIRYIVLHPSADMTMPAGAAQDEVVQITNRSGAASPILRRGDSVFDTIADDMRLGHKAFDKVFQKTTPTRGWT